MSLCLSGHFGQTFRVGKGLARRAPPRNSRFSAPGLTLFRGFARFQSSTRPCSTESITKAVTFRWSTPMPRPDPVDLSNRTSNSSVSSVMQQDRGPFGGAARRRSLHLRTRGCLHASISVSALPRAPLTSTMASPRMTCLWGFKLFHSLTKPLVMASTYSTLPSFRSTFTPRVEPRDLSSSTSKKTNLGASHSQLKHVGVSSSKESAYVVLVWIDLAL